MAARKLAKRVVAGRIPYVVAETLLMQQRSGPHYHRVYTAEDEAAQALSQAFRRMDEGRTRAASSAHPA